MISLIFKSFVTQQILNGIITGTSNLDTKYDKSHKAGTVSNAKIFNESEINEKNLLDTTDTETSDVDAVNMNKFGAKKTSRWNRPKMDVSVKDLEKVPTRRSKRISQLQKEKSQSEVKYFLFQSRLKQSKINVNK